MAFQDERDYFYPYAFLTDQRLMLEDEPRMARYHEAIFRNAAEHFEGKAVLDCGTGTGVLACWAAQAGARVVYAVEATDMARHARTLVEANGLADTVHVVHGKIEDVTLPEKVGKVEVIPGTATVPRTRPPVRSRMTGVTRALTLKQLLSLWLFLVLCVCWRLAELLTLPSCCWLPGRHHRLRMDGFAASSGRHAQLCACR